MGSQGAGIVLDFLDDIWREQQFAALGVHVYEANLSDEAPIGICQYNRDTPDQAAYLNQRGLFATHQITDLVQDEAVYLAPGCHSGDTDMRGDNLQAYRLVLLQGCVL